MISALAALFRIRLSLLNGVSAVTGVLLLPPPLPRIAMVACFGVTLLAAGGSALNQVMECDSDAAMNRTRHRPLPTGRMAVAAAIRAGACAIMAGLVLLGSGGAGVMPPLFGAAAVAGYLLVYTPLKRRTSLALPLGALCGAVPPLVGWSLAGGAAFDYRIMILCGLYFLWQMPHFWLLQRRHTDDYRTVGIPLADTGRGLLWLWVAALSVGTLMLPLFALVTPSAALWFFLFPLLLVTLTFAQGEKYLLPCLNLFPLLLTFMFLRS
jgi:protoheme IX farnesyltransferase